MGAESRRGAGSLSWLAGQREGGRQLRRGELNAFKWVERITLFMPCVLKGRIKRYLSLTRARTRRKVPKPHKEALIAFFKKNQNTFWVFFPFPPPPLLNSQHFLFFADLPERGILNAPRLFVGNSPCLECGWEESWSSTGFCALEKQGSPFWKSKLQLS